MKPFVKRFLAGALALSMAPALAAPPKLLITHNNTDVESNAWIAGIIESQHPTKAHSISKVSWTEVMVACFGHVVDGKCSAVVKMETNTATPVILGDVQLNVKTGAITPTRVSGNGYVLEVVGPGETVLSKE